MCSSDLSLSPSGVAARRGPAHFNGRLFHPRQVEISMSVLYFTEADVRDLLDMEIALAAIESAFLHLATGRAQNTPRARVRGERIMLHSMSASADYLGLVGWKCYTTTPRGARFLVGLYSSQSGELLALIEADYLGQLRTGAPSEIGRAHG